MEHYNKLTPAELERLSILSEECGEVQQAIGKILRHGYLDGKYTNRHALEKEIADVQLAVGMLIASGDIKEGNIDDFMDVKLLKIEKYLHHQGGEGV